MVVKGVLEHTWVGGDPDYNEGCAYTATPIAIVDGDRDSYHVGILYDDGQVFYCKAREVDFDSFGVKAVVTAKPLTEADVRCFKYTNEQVRMAVLRKAIERFIEAQGDAKEYTVAESWMAYKVQETLSKRGIATIIYWNKGVATLKIG